MKRLGLAALLAGVWLAAPAPAEEPQQGPPPAEETAAAEAEAPPRPAVVTEGEELIGALAEIQARLDEQRAAALEATGEDRQVLERQIVEAKIEYLASLDALVDNLLSQEKLGLEAPEVRAKVEEDLRDLGPAIVRNIKAADQSLVRLRRRRAETEPADQLALEQDIAREYEWLVTLAGAYRDAVFQMDSVGLDASAARADLVERLERGADNVQGRLAFVGDAIAELNQRIADAGEEGDLRLSLVALEERRRVLASGLSAVADVMDDLGLNSNPYRQKLVQATGEVTADVFRTGVLLGLLQEGIEDGRAWLEASGPKVLVKVFLFVLILGAFKLLASLLGRIVEGAASTRAGTSQLLQRMAHTLATRGVMFLGLLVAISQMGVELGPVLAGLGIAGFIVGFALQDSLSNFAAGVMILAYRPFDVDDVIEAGGVFGRVSHMSLVSTTVMTFDNQTLIVPNGKIWGDVIKNVTHQQERRVDMQFRISYSDEVDRAEKILNAILEEHPKVLADPPPTVKLHALQESWIEFVVRPWTKTVDYWDVYWDVTREVKRRFDAEGIEIPLPTSNVRIAGVQGA